MHDTSRRVIVFGAGNIGRSFIAPGQQQRADAVRRKLNPLTENIAGKILFKRR